MLRSLLALALFTLPLTSLADTTYKCDQDGLAVEVSIGADSASTKLTVGEDEVPALRECMTSFNGNPSLGGKWRCPHGVAGTSERYEVYPMQPRNGAPYVRIISWTGARSRSIDLKDCE